MNSDFQIENTEENSEILRFQIRIHIESFTVFPGEGLAATGD
jgi:hypothetical protein